MLKSLGGLQSKKYERDHLVLVLLIAFSNALEKATLSTIESGKMTKDLALITSLQNVEALNSEDFIKAIRINLEKDFT